MMRATSIFRRVLIIAAGLGLAAVSVLGWNWLDALVCTRVAVDGNRHAERSEILAVARVDTGVRLLDIEPSLIADRVERHPWVRRAGVRRLPPGTVAIRVKERLPVALAIDRNGRPSTFVDAEGYTMPTQPDAVYDVPLLQGLRLPENPTQRIESQPVLELLETLKNMDAGADALISTFVVDVTGDITMQTVPAEGRSAITVRLGRRGFAEKFTRLAAFWRQAVLSRPEVSFDLIDLRFDSQIVTRES